MAITKIWALHASLKAAVNYVKNDEKTTETVIADRIAKENNFIEPDMTGKTDIEIADLNKAIGYVSQNFKTEERRLVSGINCSADEALEQMNKERAAREAWWCCWISLCSKLYAGRDRSGPGSLDRTGTGARSLG